MHVSRHFFGSQPTVLRSIPFASAGPPEDGVLLQNRLLALADFSQDGEVSMGHQRPVDGCRPYSKKSTDVSTCLFWVCSNTGYLSPICKSGSQAAALKAPPCRSWPPGSQMAASGPWRCMQTPLSMTVIATSCHPTYAGGRGMHEA